MVQNLSDLSQRYNISINAMSAFIKTHRDEIDPSRDHIIKSGKSVFFDEFAVSKIDELRNHTPGITIADEIRRDEEMESLKNEINTLKTQMLVLQERTIKAQEQALAATAALNAATAAQIESAAEKARREAKIETLKQEIERLRRESADRDQPLMASCGLEFTAAGKWRKWRNRHLKW